MRPKVLGIAFLLFISISLFSQNKSYFKETWFESTPVSGDIRVGIVDNASEESVDLKKEVFYAFIAKGTHLDYVLCTEISSRDGRYKADISNLLTKNMLGNTVEFEWNTEYENKLSKYNKSEITIISKVAKSCDADPEYFTVSQWSSEKAQNIYIALNAEKKPTIKVKYKDTRDDETFECTKIPGETNVNYNYLCEIPTDQLSGIEQVNVLQNVIRLGRLKTIPYPIKLMVPDHAEN